MTDFGEARFILGMDIVMNMAVGTTRLFLEQYTKVILEKCGMLESRPSKVPMAPTYYRDGEVASKSGQGGLDAVGTRDLPCYPRIRELDVHVYEA
jgi:hypothetical protein